VNGDDAAAAIAVALGAEELLLVADVEGVMRRGAVIATLSPRDAQAVLDDGTAAGGMRAKIEAGLRAIDGGVARVRISDVAGIADAARGTMLRAPEASCVAEADMAEDSALQGIGELT
jgi:acetylglutamate kinase